MAGRADYSLVVTYCQPLIVGAVVKIAPTVWCYQHGTNTAPSQFGIVGTANW